jgi:hypothetical protein
MTLCSQRWRHPGTSVRTDLPPLLPGHSALMVAGAAAPTDWRQRVTGLVLTLALAGGSIEPVARAGSVGTSRRA